MQPGIDFTILSHSSEEILRGLADFSIDVGITYLDNEPIEGLLATPLYIERYCLFVPETHALAEREPSLGGKPPRSRYACSRPTCRTAASSTARSKRRNATRFHASKQTRS